MNTKKPIALLICISLLLSTLIGCVNQNDDDIILNDMNNESSPTPIPDETEPDGEEDDTVIRTSEGVDFDYAFSAFPADTVMIRVGNLTITWADLFVIFFRIINENLLPYPDAVINWSEELDGAMTLADIVLQYATEEAFSLLAVQYGAESTGTTLGPNEIARLQSDMEEFLLNFESIEELELSLWQNSGFNNLETFENFVVLEITVDTIMATLYGIDSELITDELVADYVEQNSFLMAKHILRDKSASPDALADAEDIYNRLLERIGSDDFFDFFDSMMHEYTEDFGGVFSFPDGYLFQPTDMVPEFSAATAALEIGEMSEIIETDFGYHIILRLPVNYDDVPFSVAASGMDSTLRQFAAFDDFYNLYQSWLDSLNPEFTPEYYSIDLEALF